MIPKVGDSLGFMEFASFKSLEEAIRDDILNKGYALGKHAESILQRVDKVTGTMDFDCENAMDIIHSMINKFPVEGTLYVTASLKSSAFPYMLGYFKNNRVGLCKAVLK